MPDPKGFIHVSRHAADKQSASERLRHWHEYEHTLAPDEAGEQASRCMDCGTPCCHSHCPVHNLIPDWNLLACEQDWRGAYEQLALTNNFPEFTGRICPAPCEDACTLNRDRVPVTIRAIELAIVEHAWAAGWIRPAPPARRNFMRVAIIGSGPAGLACAQQLVRAGYRVTVYERDAAPGGLLRFGIPDFRLDKAVLERRLRQLRAEGVRFVVDTDIGIDLSLDDLLQQSHAVVLATGARQPRDLAVDGRGLAGIHFAMDYLVRQNLRNAGRSRGSPPAVNACGLDVVVIGGGDTGSDCVGTALRQGAQSVVQLQYHDRPPEHVDNLLYWPEPAPEWHAGDHDEEGLRHLWGYDTVGFIGHNGVVRGLRLRRLRWRRCADAGWERSYADGPALFLRARCVLLAMGFAHTQHAGLVEQAGLQLDRRGNIDGNANDYCTSRANVFACGDARRGQSLVVWAIREGRQCARAVDCHLQGDSCLPEV